MDLATSVPVRAYQDSYIWYLRRVSAAVVVDPGDATPPLAYLSDQRFELAAIPTTRHHGDHRGGSMAFPGKYNVPVFGPAREPGPGITTKHHAGDSIEAPGIGVKFQVLDIPGHSMGHIP